MTLKPHSSEKGLTILELMIVILIIGIMAAIAMPTFARMKDRAIKGTTMANLDVVRRGLYVYVSDNEFNKYPVGNMDWSQLTTLIPEGNLPTMEEDAKIVNGSFQYQSVDGSTFLINALSNNRTYQPFVCDPISSREN